MPASLLDKRFTAALGWSLTGAEIAGGKLSSLLSSTWASRVYPMISPRSLICHRTASVWADITAAGQIWGLGWLRDSVPFTLDTPAAMIDGAAGKLIVYRWNSTVTTAPSTVRAEGVIPWTLAGSSVRLDVIRDGMDLTFRLTNLLTGAQVEAVMTGADSVGSGNGCRPWGIPAILFPVTTAGGVTVSRFKMGADYPFPSGRAAKALLIGDSITEGSILAGDFRQGWSYLLQDARAAAGSRDTVIAARGGIQSSGVVTALPELVGLCDAGTTVAIMIGTNDALNAVTLAAWRANVVLVLDALRRRTHKIALCCLPPLPGAATRRAEMNADIVSGYFGADLLPPVRFDLALSEANDGVTWGAGMHLGDSVHPSIAGNAAMLARLRIDCPEAFE